MPVTQQRCTDQPLVRCVLGPVYVDALPPRLCCDRSLLKSNSRIHGDLSAFFTERQRQSVHVNFGSFHCGPPDGLSKIVYLKLQGGRVC